jgi:LytS/YehU family sensor histidine kinase
MPSNNLFTTILAAVIVVLLFIVGMIAVILYARKQKLTQELKESNYQSRLNDISFAALRSQMNPHFIFNCLNSIKLYTEQNNSEAASEYLSKFALLIRNTLDNARREKVLLAQELESVKLYLELEAMRFKEKLSYSINVDDNVDIDFIEIPPAIIQPYIENAIWHGLMHKTTGGSIVINVQQTNNSESLIITIEDDGIGRKQAAALKSKSIEQHESLGTKITGERIALINEKFGHSATVNIKDIFAENNLPKGTLVTINLPIK